MTSSCVTRQNAYWNAVEPRDRRLVAGRTRRTCVVSALPDTGSREHVRFGERLVARDGDSGAFLALGQNLEEEFGAAAVEFHVAELVQAEKVDAAVAGDRLA